MEVTISRDIAKLRDMGLVMRDDLLRRKRGLMDYIKTISLMPNITNEQRRELYIDNRKEIDNLNREIHTVSGQISAFNYMLNYDSTITLGKYHEIRGGL